MKAEQVTEKILSDARAEAEEIKRQADEKQQAEQKQLDKQLAQFKEQTAALAQKAAEDKMARMLSAARMDIAKQYLAQKRKLLDEVFVKAKEQFSKLCDEEYLSLMKKLMHEAVETGDEEVVVDTNEKRIDFKFVKQANRELGPGYHGNLRLSEQRMNIGGGFILRRGQIQNNVSIGVLLDKAKKELEIELAKELFVSRDS
ncbi:MAG: V-type ATP synthase subunit E [Sedimentisphaerales bacterium]|nr:V-type ATP synthase subunit E [Sedimentisphaerales bacterium]